jgi:hypothetical protein
MKSKMNMAGAALFLLSLIVWGTGGFHTGWTQTSIEVQGVDEITGLEYTQTKDGFVPGIEFPVAGAAGGILLIAISLGVQKWKQRPQS